MSPWDPDEQVDGLLMERRGRVALLTIDRPARRNALTLATHEALVAQWRRIQLDGDVDVAVITGATDPSSPHDRQSFCAGADVDERAGSTPSTATLARAPKVLPVIAAINGYCIGAGLTMALACDLRVAAPHATFGMPEVGLGLLPGNGGVREAILQLPRAVAMELLLIPRRIDARRALEVGLVNAVVAPDDVLATALRWAEAIAGQPVEATRAAMRLAQEGPLLSAVDAARLEAELMRDLPGWGRD